MGTQEEALRPVVHRHVPGHPGADVPRILDRRDVGAGEWFQVPQVYACEQPESPDLDHVLWHGDCPACLIALSAALANNVGVILMAHGRTFRDADGRFFR